MYKIAVTVIVELHGWDMDIESTAGIAVAVCSATCWCAVNFAANRTVSNLYKCTVFHTELVDEHKCTISRKQVSAAKNWSSRQSHAVDSLMIFAVNYSGRALEIGGIINLVDPGWPGLLCSEHPPFSS